MTTNAADLTSELPRIIAGVTDAELDVIRALYANWLAKHKRNVLRSVYYDGKMAIKPFGVLRTETFGRLEAVLDWPQKAVNSLAERSVFEGFVTPSDEDDPFELSSLLEANKFDLEFPQAVTSAYKHSCAFVTLGAGDTSAGEPEVLILARSAEWSTALWDKRRRAVSAALAITASHEGAPSAMDVYLPHAVITCTRRSSGSWTATRVHNPIGEPQVEALTYDPQLDRPFGRSRISRPVMNITDRGLRTILRTEVGADFYIAPRIAALGVAEDAFERNKLEMAMDRFIAFSKDEEGDTPTVTQLPQMSVQPLEGLYRMIASQFAGATGLPISELGIVQDNPPSAEALYASERSIVGTAKRQNRIFAASLRSIAQKAIRLRDGSSEVTDEMRKISVSWMRPEFVSPGSSADALVKLATVFPWLAESDVALEWAGFSSTEITRLNAAKRRANSAAVLDRVFAPPAEETDNRLEPEQIVDSDQP